VQWGPAPEGFDSLVGSFDRIRRQWRVTIGAEATTAAVKGLPGEALDVVLDAAIEQLKHSIAVAPR